MNKNLIIIADKPGQLGNHLWAFTNIMALSIEIDAQLFFILSPEYRQMLDLSMISGSTKINVLTERTIKARLLRFLSHHFRKTHKKAGFVKICMKLLAVKFVETYIPENNLRDICRIHKVTFIDSWNQIENKTFFIRHSAYLRSLIRPDASIVVNVEFKMRQLRSEYELIVGFHIRRGDYRDFAGGNYLYDDQEYRSLMFQIKRLFPDRKILFYLCSNEDVQTLSFDGLEIRFKENESAISDMYTLSLCDYIVGPPSTSSMWAAFWNNTPITFIENPERQIGISDFRKVIAQDLFL